jgi:hypothetical protein
VVIVSPAAEIEDDSPRELKICTFNTALLPDIINALKPNAPESHIRPMEGTTEERVEKIACELLQRKDDIVCLQEVLEPKQIHANASVVHQSFKKTQRRGERRGGGWRRQLTCFKLNTILIQS